MAYNSSYDIWFVRLSEDTENSGQDTITFVKKWPSDLSTNPAQRNGGDAEIRRYVVLRDTLDDSRITLQKVEISLAGVVAKIGEKQPGIVCKAAKRELKHGILE